MSDHQHSGISQRDKDDHKRHIDGYIGVSGKIEANLPKELTDEYITGGRETNARDRNRFVVECITLFFVIVAAVFTFVQSLASIRSANAAQSAAQTAHDALVLENRPWVGLAGGSRQSARIVKGSPITVHLEIQNVGKGPALNETGVGKLLARPINVPMPSFERYSKKDAAPSITLMPDANAFVDVTTARPSDYGEKAILTDTDVQRINDGTIQLFMYGSIWYDDVFGESHRTDYCLQYVPATPTSPSGIPSFIACSTHNYAN